MQQASKSVDLHFDIKCIILMASKNGKTFEEDITEAFISFFA